MGNVRAVAAAAVVVATAVVAGSPASSYASRQSGPERLVGSHQSAHAVARTPERTAPRATPGANLGLKTYSDIQADPAHKHVFISAGPSANGVVVTSLAGKKLKTLGSTPGASGMTLSPDGHTLYVALASGDGIREINTSTLVGTTVSTGANTCPQDVAVTAGTVWFSYACDDDLGRLGSLDPSTGTVSLGLASGFGYAPYLTTSPGLDGVLFTGVPSQSPAEIARYNVTGGDSPSATLVTSRQAGSNLGDLVETPNGKDLIVASGAPYYHQVYSTTDLSDDGTYTTSNYPNAVAVNEKGQVAAGIDGQDSKDIWLFKPGATKAFKSVDFGDDDYLQPRGLAFTGQTVYAVSGPFGGPFVLHVISTKPDAPMKISTDAHAYKFGAKAHVSVHLKTDPSHRHVSIYATPLSGKTKLVRSGNLKGGKFTASYAVKDLTLFTAVYDGGKTYGVTYKSRLVKVHARITMKPKGAYGRSGGYALFHKGKNPRWVSTVAPNLAGNCVYLQVEERVTGPWQAVPGSGSCFILSSASKAVGVLSGTHVAGERVRTRAIWAGNTAILKQKTPWSYARFTG
jgi:hypothetical protein